MMQNIWHVQHADAQVSRNIIDNIKLKTQGIQKVTYQRTYTDGTTKPLLNQDNQPNSKTGCITQSYLPVRMQWRETRVHQDRTSKDDIST